MPIKKRNCGQVSANVMYASNKPLKKMRPHQTQRRKTIGKRKMNLTEKKAVGRPARISHTPKLDARSVGGDGTKDTLGVWGNLRTRLVG